MHTNVTLLRVQIESTSSVRHASWADSVKTTKTSLSNVDITAAELRRFSSRKSSRLRILGSSLKLPNRARRIKRKQSRFTNSEYVTLGLTKFFWWYWWRNSTIRCWLKRKRSIKRRRLNNGFTSQLHKTNRVITELCFFGWKMLGRIMEGSLDCVNSWKKLMIGREELRKNRKNIESL